MQIEERVVVFGFFGYSNGIRGGGGDACLEAEFAKTGV